MSDPSLTLPEKALSPLESDGIASQAGCDRPTPVGDDHELAPVHWPRASSSRPRPVEKEIARRVDEIVARFEAKFEAEIEARVQEVLAKQGKLHSADKRVETLKSAIEGTHR